MPNREFPSKVLDNLRLVKKKYKSVQYFRKNRLLFTIWLIIMDHYFNNKNNSIENIYREVNNFEKIARMTLSKYLNDAKEYGYLKYEKINKKEWNIKPTELTLKEYNEWVDTYKF